MAVLIRQHGIGRIKDADAPAKLLAVFLSKSEESKLDRMLIETVILLSMHNQTDAPRILRDTAQVCKVDVDAIIWQRRRDGNDLQLNCAIEILQRTSIGMAS